MGGLWEAGVKTAKHLLLRAVGSALLSAEELATVLVGIEALTNSRPFGAISHDPSDGEALTKGHLQTGGPLLTTPALRTPDQEGLSCLRRWRLVSLVRQMLWRRWSREYILGLQIRGKSPQQQQNIKGEILSSLSRITYPPNNGSWGELSPASQKRTTWSESSTLGQAEEEFFGGPSINWHRFDKKKFL